MAADGVRRLGPADLDGLGAAVDAVAADTWYLHVDTRVFATGVLPGADEAAPGGLQMEDLAPAVEDAFRERALGCVTVARYDLNREAAISLPILTELIDRFLLAAGGQPEPSARRGAEAR
jgi:arginase family enzyme